MKALAKKHRTDHRHQNHTHTGAVYLKLRPYIKFHVCRRINFIISKTFMKFVGDWVYLKLRPYKQLSSKSHTHEKLSNFYRPYQITQK